MEAIFHAPIPELLKLIGLKGNANNGKIGSIATNIKDRAPATPVVINAAKLQRLIFNDGHEPLLIDIFIPNELRNAIIVIAIGITMNK